MSGDGSWEGLPLWWGPEGEDKFHVRTRPFEEPIKKTEMKTDGQEKGQTGGGALRVDKRKGPDCVQPVTKSRRRDRNQYGSNGQNRQKVGPGSCVTIETRGDLANKGRVRVTEVGVAGGLQEYRPEKIRQ